MWFFSWTLDSGDALHKCTIVIYPPVMIHSDAQPFRFNSLSISEKWESRRSCSSSIEWSPICFKCSLHFAASIKQIVLILIRMHTLSTDTHTCLICCNSQRSEEAEDEGKRTKHAKDGRTDSVCCFLKYYCCLQPTDQPAVVFLRLPFLLRQSTTEIRFVHR